MRCLALVLMAALSVATAGHAQDIEAVRAVMAKAAAAPRFDRPITIDVLTVLAADGLTPEESFLISQLAEEGQGRIKIPFKDREFSVPRPTYDAQRLMDRLLSPLDLTRLWLKGPELMADLRDLARLSPVFDTRIKTFIAGQLARAWGQGADDEKAMALSLYDEALVQLQPPGSGPAEVQQAQALLAGAIAKIDPKLGAAFPAAK